MTGLLITLTVLVLRCEGSEKSRARNKVSNDQVNYFLVKALYKGQSVANLDTLCLG